MEVCRDFDDKVELYNFITRTNEYNILKRTIGAYIDGEDEESIGIGGTIEICEAEHRDEATAKAIYTALKNRGYEPELGTEIVMICAPEERHTITISNFRCPEDLDDIFESVVEIVKCIA